MSVSRRKALGVMLASILVAGCNIGEGPGSGTGPISPLVIILPTPMYSGGIYDGVIDSISGSGSNCATNGNFGGLIDEDGNAYLADSNGCSLFSNNIGAGNVQLMQLGSQNFFPEIIGNFDIYRIVGEPAAYSGAIVGGVSGSSSYCTSADVAGLNGNVPGTGAIAGSDPISHVWAQANVSNNSPVEITSDGICGELATTGNGANQIVGFYSEQAPGAAGENLYNKDSSTSLLDSRWVDFDNAITLTIDANGAVIDSVNFCQISGTFAIDNPDINVYNAELDYGPTCPFTFSGKGWLSADNANLTLIGTFGITLNGTPEKVGAPVYNLQRVVP